MSHPLAVDRNRPVAFFLSNMEKDGMPPLPPALPVVKLPTFEEIAASVPSFEEICVGLPSFAEVAEGIVFPDAEEPTFDPIDNPEVNTAVRLAGDLSHIRTPTSRSMVDFRANPAAYRHLEQLPGPGASLHGVISGKYALYELIPGLIERTGQPMVDLTIATLSFSRQNAADLLAMLDAGKIQRVGLLISYFFKAQNRENYDSLIPALRDRGHKVLSMRNHAKLILAKMADGTCWVVESSANLRSSDNVEVFILTQCPQLYDFHHNWIHGQLLNGRELGGD